MQCAPSSGLEPELLRALALSAIDVRCAVGVAVDIAQPSSRAARRRSATLAALAELGVDAAVEPATATSGEPLWPDGLVGSLSHSDDCSLAVVAESSTTGGLGIDLERDVRVSHAFARRVCSDAEFALIRRWAADPEGWALVVFSAKEAVYKLQFPYSRQVVGLRRVEIELQEDERFVATFREALPPFERGFALEGSWRRQHGMILTSAWLRLTWHGSAVRSKPRPAAPGATH